MKKLFNIILSTFLLALVTSCVDDDKLFELDDFETGAVPNIQRTSNDLGFVNLLDLASTTIEFTVDFSVDGAQSPDGGLTSQGDGRESTSLEFSKVESVQLEVSFQGSANGGAVESGFVQNITSWPTTITFNGVDELVAAIPSLSSPDDIALGDFFAFVCGVTLADGRVLPAFVTDASGNRTPNYSVNYTGTLNNPNIDIQATYFVACPSNLIPEGTAIYDLSTNVTSTCCGLALGPQLTGRTATITDLGSGNYRISDILAGHIMPFNIDPEPIDFVDICETYTLANGPSVLNYTGPGSSISIDSGTGVIIVNFNNAGNAIAGVATLTPQ